MPLITLILLPFIGSLLAAVLPANARNTESTLAGLIALFCTVQAALYFPEIADGGVIRQEITWLPTLGLNFVLRMGLSTDDLKLLTALVVAVFLTIPYWKGKYFTKVPVKKGGKDNA